ncbi:hypothetical protein L1274_000922 [Duganella sp. HSC-15S17]|uniref:Uncharacterized protein n=1 Tax=Duganella violaceipulchra TaxID=2849652 RepID=A0ABT1GE44_9BURK|nr:hypothetical protein [Duganella violaceicalia]
MSVTQDYKSPTKTVLQNAALCVCCALLIAAGPILSALGLLKG